MILLREEVVQLGSTAMKLQELFLNESHEVQKYQELLLNLEAKKNPMKPELNNLESQIQEYQNLSLNVRHVQEVHEPWKNQFLRIREIPERMHWNTE